MKPEYYQEYVMRLRGAIMKHPRYEEVRSALDAYINLSAPGTVLALVGPTRAGKSTVAAEVRAICLQNWVLADPDDKPIINIEAANARDGLFTMKHLTLRTLAELKHPILGNYGRPEDQVSYKPRIMISETHLRIAMEYGFQYRRTRVLLVDEAGNMLVGRSKVRASEVLESIKSLGNTCQIIIVFIGGYSLLPHLLTSAHLNGRLRIIHFSEYTRSLADQKKFGGILKTLSDRVPLRPGESLLDYWDSLHEGSLGSYGLLTGWLEAAICLMAASGDRYLHEKHLRHSRLEAQLEKIRNEIEIGKKYLEQVNVTKVPYGVNMEPKSEIEHAEQKRRPFKRKPTRDPVGQTKSAT